MLKILAFVLLTSAVYGQEDACIGGKNCTCTCTKHKNRYYKEFVKQGRFFPKLICECFGNGCDSKGCDNKEPIPEFKIKKTNNCCTLLP